MAHEFECKREVVLPGSPEDVWAAVATAAGNNAWLFTNDTDPEGPATKLWDPPHRFVVRQEHADWFNALDFQIEARDGTTTILRYAHSGIFTDDWENQYDAVGQHTDFYLHTLGQYLEHFNSQTATYVGGGPGGLQGPSSTAQPDGFDRLKQALGLRADLKVGDAVELTPDGLPALQAVVDYDQPNFLGVRTADGLYRFFGRNAFGAPVGMSIHLFVTDVDAEQVTNDWQGWLDTLA
jgi:hypothetical protein